MALLQNCRRVRGATKMEVAAIRLLIEKHLAIFLRSKSTNLSPKFFQSGNPKKTVSIGKFRCLKLILRKKNLSPSKKPAARREFLWFLVAKMKVIIFRRRRRSHPTRKPSLRNASPRLPPRAARWTSAPRLRSAHTLRGKDLGVALSCPYDLPIRGRRGEGALLQIRRRSHVAYDARSLAVLKKQRDSCAHWLAI